MPGKVSYSPFVFPQTLEEILNLQAPPHSPSALKNPTDPSPRLRHQEVMTQNELLKQQVSTRSL